MVRPGQTPGHDLPTHFLPPGHDLDMPGHSARNPWSEAPFDLDTTWTLLPAHLDKGTPPYIGGYMPVSTQDLEGA
jgi:hypothetical protein